MIFGSVCSGIEAASAAWLPLGWECAFVSEIEPFPCAVLAHHYPEVPNRGDMTKFKEWPDANINVLIGGTPCQSFSVAGLRKGLDDARGNLMLTFGEVAARFRPAWFTWENVPGVLSSGGGADFAAFLGLVTGQTVLPPKGGWRKSGILPGTSSAYGVAWRILDAQYFGVAQRRRRVFVVGYLGDWRRAAAVLFERESMSGNPPPSREKGKGSTGDVAVCLRSGSGNPASHNKPSGLEENLIPELARSLRAQAQASHREDTETYIPQPHADISPAIKARDGKGVSSDSDSDGDGAILVPMVTHSLRAGGFDASGDGTGRGTPLVPVPFDTTQITSKANRSTPKAGDPCHPLAAGAHAPATAFPGRMSATQTGGSKEEVSPTIGSENPIAVAYPLDLRNAGRDPEKHDEVNRQGVGTGAEGDPAGTVSSAFVPGVATPTQVRRLTPMECERLQGFPDGYTAIPNRGKPAADGPRYKALGNSMAVPVITWIGRRIEMVEAMTTTTEGE